MSGRSAHVRKEKTKTKDKNEAMITAHRVNAPTMQSQMSGHPYSHEELQEYPREPALHEFPLPAFENGSFNATAIDRDYPVRLQSSQTVRSAGSISSDDMAYARVRKPVLPSLDVSGIEKSSFRAKMDQQSDAIRSNLTKAFRSRKKKAAEEPRPQTSAAMNPESVYGMPASLPPQPQPQPHSNLPPPMPRTISDQTHGHPPLRNGPPNRSLPALPHVPQLKRWVGAGKPPAPWNKLRKDPELWDPNGDTLVFFNHETHNTSRPPPSFRLSSHVIESFGSDFLDSVLADGVTERHNNYGDVPSPVSSPGLIPVGMRRARNGRESQASSNSGRGGNRDMMGQISYEIYFPAPLHASKGETLRHQITTRNVFALLYRASLVGLNLFQALHDLHVRLESWLPSDQDAASMIVEYIIERGLLDVRNDPSSAMGLLAFSEGAAVRWQDGWTEAFVHCAGMYNKLEGLQEWKDVSPVSKALLDRASLDMGIRVQSVEDRLSKFDFSDMWPQMTATPPAARASFERLRSFFVEHYKTIYGSWPAPLTEGEDQWLTRTITQQMSKDFGALYDYLVDRDIVWECSEERASRKWEMKSTEGNMGFTADSHDLPLTDILIAFDNRSKFPHIPHPYPLVPESIPVHRSANFNKQHRPAGKTPDEKLAERRAALAYTEATNIYVLGSDFANNDLVDAYVRFEKNDHPSEIDPYDARRGRWVLIYGILQTLASISVDTPLIRWKDDCAYYLNPHLRGTPPWREATQNISEASHEASHCWITKRGWKADEPTELSNSFVRDRIYKPSYQSFRSSTAESDNGTVSSMALSSTATSMASSIKSPKSTSGFSRKQNRLNRESDNTSYSSYSPNVEKKYNEWPPRDESRNRARADSRDDYSRIEIKSESRQQSQTRSPLDGTMSPRLKDSPPLIDRELNPRYMESLHQQAQGLIIKDFDDMDDF